MSKELIRLDQIAMEYKDVKILNNINLYFNDSEFLTILGPSGCGKTTTLRIIGGFTEPTSGRVLFDGKDITHVPPHKRNVNTVFQRYALFSHLNVYENIAFGLRIKKVKKEDIAPRVKEMLELVNLRGYDERDISQLSGGEQQRVAIARALVNQPKVLLLDEPLGALDLKLRKEMQIELKRIQQRLGITFIFVTHDQEEALTMSDTVVVMNKGSIQQIGTPIDIYNEPKNAFVADFIGESNILSGVMRKDFLVTFHDTDFVCVDKGFDENEPIDVVIRPEDIKLVGTSEGQICGKIESVVFKGVHYEMVVKTDKFDFLVHSTKCGEVGSEVGVLITPEDIHIMRKVGGVK